MDSKHGRDVLDMIRINSKPEFAGNCPWCFSSVSMRNFPVSRCRVCWQLINWDIEDSTIKKE
jgi:hypothetical protein